MRPRRFSRILNCLAGATASLLGCVCGIGTGAAATPPFESPDPVAARGEVDRLVFERLEQLGLEPAAGCSDAVFLRRVYLDVIGTLPTAREARAFLLDRDPDKRARLIDQLLQRDEFAVYWAMKWGDLLRVKAEFPINLWPNAVQAYHRWIQTSLKENKPYDQFARELLTSSGSNFRVAPVNFYRAVQSKEPPALAQAVALTFMGTRVEKWPADRRAGMAAFFDQVGYKSTAEWKEEIVFHDATRALSRPPVFPDGTPAPFAAGADPREVFADWLTRPSNPWFARNLVNRVWSWLLGRGIIHEPDDVRSDNPPQNPELLTFLEREFIRSHFDLRQVYRLILNSQTYQLSSIPRGRGGEAAANFAAYPLRRLDAEVLIDALCQVTGTTEKYTSPIPEPFTFIPEDERSIALADGSTTSSFLELFGRPARDTGWESERNNRPTAAQRLHLLNSSHIRRKLEQGPNLRRLVQRRTASREAVTEIYLTILSRFPTDEELRIVEAHRGSGGIEGMEADVDVAWALINSAEFLYRH